MQLYCDRTGFPVLKLDKIRLQVLLLPVTKAQFERFLAEPNELDNEWYEQVLAINPRASWQRFRAERREQVFLTGILPSEALAFAHWMGKDFDLPTVDEWRTIDRLLMGNRLTKQDMHRLKSLPMHRAAWGTVQRVLRQVNPSSWGQLALLRGGLIEWVRSNGEFWGLGSPRPQFYPNTLNPQRDDPVRPLHNQRLPYFGFRLVRRLHAENQEGDLR